MARTPRTPWKKANPRKRAGKAAKHLSSAQKSAAKARAKRAGRHYPNLVDNMRMAVKKTTKKKATKKASAKKRVAKKSSAKKSSAKKSSAKKSSAKKSSAKTSASSTRRKTTKRRTARKGAHPQEKDPHGGLTAAGRKAFADRDGSHLKPGVTKKASEMTPQEMRRKGSWALRFYGRKTMPPLVDANGEPTRHALSAYAWGEPVPKTVAAARKIADKGERLLARYHQIKDKG